MPQQYRRRDFRTLLWEELAAASEQDEREIAAALGDLSPDLQHQVWDYAMDREEMREKVEA